MTDKAGILAGAVSKCAPPARALALALALLAVGSCGDDGDGGGGDTTTTGAGDTTTTGAGETTTTGSGETTTTGGGGTATTDPSGPDIQLFTVPECSVVPGGALSGADNLTMFVAVRNGGPGEVNRLVPVAVQSDRGHRARPNAAISTGSSFNPLQVDLSPSDYNQSLRFVITADPDNEIVERDESNNELIVTVRLPDRPTTSQDVPCSSP